MHARNTFYAINGTTKILYHHFCLHLGLLDQQVLSFTVYTFSVCTARYFLMQFRLSCSRAWQQCTIQVRQASGWQRILSNPVWTTVACRQISLNNYKVMQRHLCCEHRNKEGLKNSCVIFKFQANTIDDMVNYNGLQQYSHYGHLQLSVTHSHMHTFAQRHMHLYLNSHDSCQPEVIIESHKSAELFPKPHPKGCVMISTNILRSIWGLECSWDILVFIPIRLHPSCITPGPRDNRSVSDVDLTCICVFWWPKQKPQLRCHKCCIF